MDIKELQKACLCRSNRANGFIVEVEKGWYHFRNLKGLIKFIKNLYKRHKKFEVYRCSNKKKMGEEQINILIKVGEEKKERLILDDIGP